MDGVSVDEIAELSLTELLALRTLTHLQNILWRDKICFRLNYKKDASILL